MRSLSWKAQHDACIVSTQQVLTSPSSAAVISGPGIHFKHKFTQLLPLSSTVLIYPFKILQRLLENLELILNALPWLGFLLPWPLQQDAYTAISPMAKRSGESYIGTPENSAYVCVFYGRNYLLLVTKHNNFMKYLPYTKGFPFLSLLNLTAALQYRYYYCHFAGETTEVLIS